MDMDLLNVITRGKTLLAKASRIFSVGMTKNKQVLAKRIWEVF